MEHIWSVEWDDSLSVGIPEIDKEHQDFILLIDGLNQAIVDRKGLAEIQRRMQLILDDWDRHYHEAEVLRQWHYPDADDHAKKHDQVAKRLQAIMAALGDGGFELEWITAWLNVKDTLFDHLFTEDMKYRDYYRSMSHEFVPPRWGSSDLA